MAERNDPSAALCVLGSISINIDGQPVSIGGEKPRRLLAMLILNRNAVVSAERLMEVIWGDRVPDAGLPTLQSYVSRLRRLLPPSARLATQAPGYRLVVDPGTTDADRFEAALGLGLDVMKTSPQTTLRHLDEALAEWRGEAYAEFADEWWAQAEASRLGELRLHAREARVTALLALRLDERAASEAEALTVDHPWRETPWRAMLLALYRAGRQGDALRKASEYRARLRDDLGLEPSAEFVSLEGDLAKDAEDLRLPPPPVDPLASLAPFEHEVSAGPRSVRRKVAKTEVGGLRLFGRDEDVASVVELCERHRLVTLLGTGGIGKTQLALRVVAELVASDRSQCEVVELARVRDQDSVVGAIATQLDVQTQQGRSVTESVLDLLGHRSLLLVLDNCEHVLDTVAGFAERLIGSCPGVRILATSRESLALPDETVFKVKALPVPGEGSDPNSSPAVALFLQRAHGANPDFVADEAATEAVVELCRRLDGVPLAIELAAARTRSFSPTEMLERFGDRFVLLAGSSRVSDRRHRSLQDLVDWSYHLLEPSAQQLFRRLSTFAGSFDLEAVEQVCGYGDVPRESVAPVLASLVDKSIVQAHAGPRTTFRLLETLRDYGIALAGDERVELAQRHGAWIMEICERAAAGVQGVDEAASHPLAAAAWGIVAYGRFVRGEIDAAIDLAERSMELARRHGTDTLGLAERALGNACVFRGQNDRGGAAVDQLVDGAVDAGDEARIAHALYMRSLLETIAADATVGMDYADRAVEAAARCQNPTALAQAAYSTGIWLTATEPARAREELERSEALSRDVGNLWFELFARTETLWLTALDGQPLEALGAFADVISAWHRGGDWANQWLSLRHVFGICYLLRADELAVTIHGALERAGAVNAFPFEPAAAANLTRQVGELRERLDE